MFRDLSEDSFIKTLQTYLSPTAPIQSQENLFGRDVQVRQIEQALHSSGRSVFIYGDRGVGKTSLAQTVAFRQQATDGDPVLIACDSNTTFSGIMSVIGRYLIDPRTTETTTRTAKLGVKNCGYEVAKIKPGESISSNMDLNEAVRMMKSISEGHYGPTVVVVDEFDRIERCEERVHFADFIKQIGDQRVGIQFIFCGVAESLDELLGSHESCYRYLQGVELLRLNWDARFQIIDRVAGALNVEVGNRARFRIAAISDGFPHYVHLICEKLLWEMYNDPLICTQPTNEHYENAISAAVLGIEQHLKKAYEKATVKDTADYETVLWAIADNSNLIRHIDDIYQSCCHIVSGMGIDPLDRNTFVARLQSLKSLACGQILVSNRRSWYQFRQNITRGYVRLRAEEQGLELASDISSDGRSSSTWTPRGAKTQRMRYSNYQWRRG